MEKLTTCCKILYDYDMIDKVNKIKSLEEDLFGPPVLRFNTFSEFQSKKINFLRQVKILINEWSNQISKKTFTNKSYVVRGLKTCNYDHFWHQHTLTPQFQPIKLTLIKLIHEFYDLDFQKKKNNWLINMIENVFIGITGTFYVFTQLDFNFEKDFVGIIFSSFEKQIYMHLFLKEHLFELKCTGCGETIGVHWDEKCFKCSYIPVI